MWIQREPFIVWTMILIGVAHMIKSFYIFVKFGQKSTAATLAICGLIALDLSPLTMMIYFIGSYDIEGTQIITLILALSIPYRWILSNYYSVILAVIVNFSMIIPTLFIAWMPKADWKIALTIWITHIVISGALFVLTFRFDQKNHPN